MYIGVLLFSKSWIKVNSCLGWGEIKRFKKNIFSTVNMLWKIKSIYPYLCLHSLFTNTTLGCCFFGWGTISLTRWFGPQKILSSKGAVPKNTVNWLDEPPVTQTRAKMYFASGIFSLLPMSWCICCCSGVMTT